MAECFRCETGVVQGRVPIFSVVSAVPSTAPCAEIMVHLRTWKEKCWPISNESIFFIKYDVSPTATKKKKMSLIYLSRKEGRV